MATSSNLWQNIKDHPIVIVLGFCSITAAGTATIYEKFVLPYHVKELESQVSDLKKTIFTYPDSKKIISGKDLEIKRLKIEVASLRQKTIELSGENVFSLDDPHPKSFRDVRIGDPFSKVEQYYAGRTEKDEDHDYIIAKISDFFFSSVTFYPESSNPKGRVNAILYILNYFEDKSKNVSPEIPINLDDLNQRLEDKRKPFVKALEKQLIERYGEGAVSKRSRFWTVRGISIELNERGGTLTLRNDKRAL